ncbi:MAG: hypothetical protein JXA42_02140 [Anaerolineales bacterium]|nr:hypothetical protein [Anaerolineales bacterium]
MIAFTHVNVIPMTGEIIIKDQTVLVEGSKIVDIGNSDTVQVPESAQVIDGDGAYLLPGLADMHMHTRADWEDRDVWPIHPLYLYLANGVTTIRDFTPYGSPLTNALQWRDEIQAGTRVGPSIYASGKLLYASPLDDPTGIVHQNHDMGFDFIKQYSYLSKDDFHQAMQTAKELNMYTAGHIPYVVGLEGVLTDGMDEIAHVEELLPEFFNFDRNKILSPEEWMPYIIKSVLNQIDITSPDLDFEQVKSETMAWIFAQIKAADVPVCNHHGNRRHHPVKAVQSPNLPGASRKSISRNGVFIKFPAQ